VGVMVAFAQLFVDGSVPRYLRQWYGGGTLVGIGKDDKPLDEDARPIVCGEAWKRVACKVAFLDGKKELAEELKPHQVAVGMPGGAETCLHALRQWVHRCQGDGKSVLLKRDYENAFNEAEPEEFLAACYRSMPGCARLAEWCYGEPVRLGYNGGVVMSTKGQQGCPLMMPMYCAMRKEMRDSIVECRDLTIQADYADDGMDGREAASVLKVLKAEMRMRKGMEPNLTRTKWFCI